MDQEDRLPARLTRRKFLRASIIIPPAVALAACAKDPPRILNVSDTTATPQQPAPDQLPSATAATASTHAAMPTPGAALLEPTPACADDDEPTPPQTEGPFFTPQSPQRVLLLEPGMAGVKMILTGLVLSTDCQPIAGALLDFWHADDAGVYDNEGYKLRGHQFSDADGRYRLETIVPGLYPGRTRHFHVKVQAAGQPVLTTQLYFPDEPANERDQIFHPALLIELQDSEDGKAGSFNFVLATG